MVETYCKNLPLSKDLDPQESMYGEELLSMVCNVLVQVPYVTSRKSSLCCTQKFILELFFNNGCAPLLACILIFHGWHCFSVMFYLTWFIKIPNMHVSFLFLLWLMLILTGIFVV